MTGYKGFAYLYDSLMSGVPYAAWASYIDNALTSYLGQNRASHIVLDMACGTGNITIPLAKLGYDMIGVDISIDMLSQAQAKASGNKVLFLAQDMRELDLYGTIDAAVCVCDGMNYILCETELQAVFSRLRMFLNPGGVFIFDMNTPYKFKEILGNKTFTTDTEGDSYEWDNHFNEETGINEYRVTFTPIEGESFFEVHNQRAYPASTISDLLLTAGFCTVEMYDGYCQCAPVDKTERIVFIARTKEDMQG